MKKLVIAALATAGFSLGVFAQGGITLDSSACAYGIKLQGAALYYDGTGGIEIWYKNNASGSDLSGINGAANNNAAYALLTGDGFTMATSFHGAAISSGGFTLGDLRQPGIAGSGNVEFAVVAWNGNTTSWASSANGGVLAMLQPVNNYVTSPSLGDPDLTSSANQTGVAGSGGFNAGDLTMNTITPVPEPATFALAGLGAAALMIFRKRK